MGIAPSAAPAMQACPSLKGRDVLVVSPTPTFPLDAGNRRRVYRVCRDLQDLGARIHFVYYPFEWPFTSVPQSHLREMSAQWDAFYLVPASRDLQSPPAGTHHHIDEWWDPALEPLLSWLMKRGRFDAMIVNYPYLSKAFQWANPGTLKILDTHDRFTGRKEILASMGVAPEYFYTTEDQERIALDRADIVWAIKEEEAVEFRRITSRVVMTMPHHEPLAQFPARAAAAEDDLVVGMVGARNSVNLRNAMLFVEQVLPRLARQLAPVRVRFGGGMCDDLKRLPRLPAGVELAGRFDRLEDFYSEVDAVLVPLAYSTGLKIKAVEAFALGLPVIAHRHAVEGIPVRHPFQQCESPKELANAIAAVAFDRGKLIELRAATVAAAGELVRGVRRTQAATAAAIVARPTIVMTVAPELMAVTGAYPRHLFETIDYLKYLGDVVLYLDRPLEQGVERWRERFDWRSSELKLVFSPAAAARMGVADDWRQGTPLPVFASVETLPQLLQRLPASVLWIEELCSDLLDGLVPDAVLDTGYVRLDTLELLERPPAQVVRDWVAARPGLTKVHAGPLSSTVPGGGRSLTLPFWRSFGDVSWESWSWASLQQAEVWLVTSKAGHAVATGIRLALQALEPGRLRTRLVATDSVTAQEFDALLRDDVHTHLSTWQQALAELEARERRPRFVIDVSLSPGSVALLEEACHRLRIPFLVAYRPIRHDSAHGALDDAKAEPWTARQLVARLAALMASGEHPRGDEHARYHGDAGWEALWRRESLRKTLAGTTRVLA